MAEAEELRGQQGTDRFLSQVLDNHNQYRVFVPLVDDGKGGHTVAAATIVGRNMDFEKMGSSFVVIDYDINDLGQVRDITGLDRLARIAGVMYEAEYRREVAKAKREAQANAEELKRHVDEGALSVQLVNIDAQYHGTKINGQNIPPSKRQAIGQVTVTGITNLSIIKLTATGEPEDTTPTRVALVLSSVKITQFKEGLRKMTPQDIERGYLEFNYNYDGDDKPAAGRAAKFEYIDPTRWLQTTYPVWYNKNGTNIKDRLLTDPEVIAAKNKNISYTPEVADVVLRFKTYMQNQMILMPYVDTEASLTKNAAEDLLKYEVINSFETLRNKLIELASNGTTEADDQATTSKEAGVIASTNDQVAAMEQVGAENYDTAAAAGFEDDTPGIL